MSTEQKIENHNRYYTIIDGTFRVQVPQNHEDAVRRDWTSKDGKNSGTKYEKHVKALFGKVESISITDGEYGKNLNIALDENEEGETPVISLKCEDRYGEDTLKKLPNLQKEVEYRFMPFSFVPQGEEKEKRGLSIASKDEEGIFTVKVFNFFYDPVTERNINGYPVPTDEDAEDWPFYFKKANKFMVKYAEENVLPKFAPEKKEIEYPTEEIKPEDVPF